MIFQGRTFQGIRYALFNFNTTGDSGGYADFDRFTVTESHPSGFTRPIPAGKTITLESMLTEALIGVNSNKLASIPKSDPAARTRAVQFKVEKLPLGRVSLKSVADGRFLTVTGLGEAGQVSLEKARKPGDDSQAFQWVEMPCGDLLLLSLISHRYLRLNAEGTLTADAPGAQADHKNGASFSWSEIASSPAPKGNL